MSREAQLNNMAKGEFLLFKALVLSEMLGFLTIPKQALFLISLQKRSFENTVGKGEMACQEQFLLFLQCLLPVWRTI